MELGNNRSCTTLLLALLYSSIAGGQMQKDTIRHSSLTLAEVWKMAESGSRSVRIKQLQLESSIEAVKDAKADRLPELNVGGLFAEYSNMPIYKNGVFHTPTQFKIIHTYYVVGADAYFNLYNGNKVNIEIDARMSESRIASEQRDLTLSEIKLHAAAYYLDMQRCLIFKELLLTDLAAQEKQLLHIKTLQDNGVVLKSDVLRAELKLSRQQLSLVELNNDLAIANQKLNILIGLPDEQKVIPEEFTGPDPTAIRPYTDFLEDAGSHAWLTRISAQETELRRLKLKSIKANVSPKLGLVGNYNYSYPQIIFFPYSGNPYGLGYVGIKASFPLSGLYLNSHKVKMAELEYQSQRIEHLRTEDVVRQQLNEAYLRYQEMLNRVEVTKTNVLQAMENRRIVNNTYFNQLSLITDLLDADTQLLQTRFDLAAAKIAAEFQYYRLLNITGKL
jgi:outer membrane protein